MQLHSIGGKMFFKSNTKQLLSAIVELYSAGGNAT